MADGVQLKFTNIPDVINRMRNLDSKVQRSIARRSTAKGARVIRDAVIARAARLDDPSTATNISKNVVVQWAGRLARREQGAAYRIGIKGGAKQYANTKVNVRKGRAGKSYKTDGGKTNAGGDTFYWRFLEFGTSKMAARPFIRPAAAQFKDRAIKVAIDEALSLISIETKKAGQ